MALMDKDGKDGPVQGSSFIDHNQSGEALCEIVPILVGAAKKGGWIIKGGIGEKLNPPLRAELRRAFKERPYGEHKATAHVDGIPPLRAEPAPPRIGVPEKRSFLGWIIKGSLF